MDPEGNKKIEPENINKKSTGLRNSLLMGKEKEEQVQEFEA
jgi:hypothetical protein